MTDGRTAIELSPRGKAAVETAALWHNILAVLSPPARAATQEKHYEVEDVADEATPKRVIVYSDAQGKEPFTVWLNGLRDRVGRQRILARLARLVQGNYGDCTPVGEGVSELRLLFGPGYRVYCGEHGFTIVVLLCGGDRDSQPRDIRQAQAYWQEYRQHENV